MLPAAPETARGEPVEPVEPVELRVLDGPNLYFPRPAVKLVLDARPLLDLSEGDATSLARRLGLRPGRPGVPAGEQRQRWAARAVTALARRTAVASGTVRLALRVRPGPEPGQLVVAYPWRRRGRAEAFGRALAGVLAGVVHGDVETVVAKAAHVVRRAPDGPSPAVLRPRVPVVCVTGTNGKTTTTRLVAHMARCAGWRVGWSNTDGIYVDGVLVEAGDWSGPGGARRVLAEPGLDIAVLETARGGILLRGIAVAHNDVAVVTNVSADHLGLQGVRNLDELAEVKATTVRITRPDGWVVLNGDDPRVIAMRELSRAKPWVFSLGADSPSMRTALMAGGRAVTVLDGAIAVLYGSAETDELLPVADVPVTLAGLSSYNVANALAATAAALAAGLPRGAVVEGLRSFASDASANPGRMNLYDVHGTTVVLDLAHNAEGLRALLEVARGLCAPGARLTTVLGTAGDRRDEDFRTIGELGALGSDSVVAAAKRHYLRDRTPEEMISLLREGAAAAGACDVAAYDDELAATRAVLEAAKLGDVVAVMCHEQRVEIDAELRDRGGRALGPDDVRRLAHPSARS